MQHDSHRNFVIYFTFILVGLILVNCKGTLSRIEKPRITLAGIQVEEVKVFETVFNIQLRVFNTNDFPIIVKGLDCEMEMNGKPFAMGITSSNIEIPAYGTTVVPVIVYSSVLDVVRGIAGLQDKEKLSYQIKGHLRLSSGVFSPSTIPFKSEGEFSIKELIDKEIIQKSNKGFLKEDNP